MSTYEDRLADQHQDRIDDEQAKHAVIDDNATVRHSCSMARNRERG